MALQRLSRANSARDAAEENVQYARMNSARNEGVPVGSRQAFQTLHRLPLWLLLRWARHGET